MRLGLTKAAAAILGGISGGALLLGAPASAQQGGQQTAAAKPQQDANRIICEKIMETGSRVASRRVCMTALQWEEQRRRDRENLQDAQQRSLEPNSS